MPKKNQISLFLIENPLRDAKWETTFKNIPSKPGVYSFLGHKGEVIYVGKAKNLRQRLMSYRFINSTNVSNKTLHLVSSASTIKWRVLCNEFQALLEEDRLIKHFKPSLNVVNNQFEKYYFIHLFSTEKPLKWEVRLSMRHDLANSTYCFGAFKGHKSFRMALGSILRLLFILSLPKSRPKAIPVMLLRKLTPTSFVLLLRPYTLNRLIAYLQGKHFCLLREFEHKIGSMLNHLSKADSLLLEDDFARLHSFYFRNCKPLYHNSRAKAFTHKNQLDTAIIKWSKPTKD